MLRWALAFLSVAIVAAVLGFGGLSPSIAEVAKLFFYLFLVLALLTLFFCVATGRRPST